ncbi:MAG TPA: F0F1 ATP synthase subunit gamma [Candidatus Paceibacterota bacterium]|nr:F0F1 ATP synthase subunit gamma [Candidatus Paceibacterota bacterium]
MSRLTDLTRLLAEYQAADAAAGSLEDITALRTRAIRRAFEKNAAFFADIRALYDIVSAQPRDPARAEAADAPTRTLFVALTSNRRFFSGLISRIIEKLREELANEPDAEAVVIGSVGWEFCEETGVPARARYMPFADDTPTPEELASLVGTFAGFGRVVILHPAFVNVFRQEVAVEDITHSPEQLPEPASAAFPEGVPPLPGIPEAAIIAARTSGEYILEPDATALLGFFDTQVRHVLFDRVLLESDLARTAARLMRLTEAQSRARALVDETRRAMIRASAARASRELLETFAGLAAWNRS